MSKTLQEHLTIEREKAKAINSMKSTASMLEKTHGPLHQGFVQLSKEMTQTIRQDATLNKAVDLANLPRIDD